MGQIQIKMFRLHFAYYYLCSILIWISWFINYIHTYVLAFYVPSQLDNSIIDQGIHKGKWKLLEMKNEKKLHGFSLEAWVDQKAFISEEWNFKMNENSHFALEIACGNGLWLFTIQHEIVIGEWHFIQMKT